MTKYKLYAGIGDNCRYMYTDDFDSEEEAELEAYQLALDEYATYEGTRGIASFQQVVNSYMRDYGIRQTYDLTDSDWATIEEEYRIEVEGWINYRVEVE